MPKHVPLLDGERDVAALLVFASHAFLMLPEPSWAVKRPSDLGFCSVQLFFAAGCTTFANSWRRNVAGSHPGLRSFALLCRCRVATAYLLAAVGYAWLKPFGNQVFSRTMVQVPGSHP